MVVSSMGGPGLVSSISNSGVNFQSCFNAYLLPRKYDSGHTRYGELYIACSLV